MVRALAAFPRDDVEDFLAVLVLTRPAPQPPLDDDAALLVGRFAARAGIARGSSAADARAGIDAYLAHKPLSEAVITAVHALARERAASATGTDVGDALARFAGETAPTGVLGGGGERPKGTVPAGPMARFVVDKKRE